MILSSYILIGVLALCVLANTADLFHLRYTLRKMLRGSKDKATGTCADLGEALIKTGADIENLEKFRSDMESYLKEVEERLRRSTQAAETIRFNAFRGDGLGGSTGGNQSFATAFLSENGDGTVLSSLYTRERVSIFAKPIAKFDSSIELTEEERRAVSLAKTKLARR